MTQKLLSRTVQDVGNGCLGVSIPKEFSEVFDVEQGDEVVFEMDPETGDITYKLGD